MACKFTGGPRTNDDRIADALELANKLKAIELEFLINNRRTEVIPCK